MFLRPERDIRRFGRKEGGDGFFFLEEFFRGALDFGGISKGQEKESNYGNDQKRGAFDELGQVAYHKGYALSLK